MRAFPGFRPVTLLLSILLGLGGCGWYTNSAVDQAGEIPNSNQGSSGQIIDDDEDEDDTPVTPTDPNEIRLFVKATTGMQEASVSQWLWELLTPPAAYALSSGSSVTNARITVEQLDFQGDIVAGNLINPSDYTVFLRDDGAYSIRFQAGIPSRLDLVIVARLTNGTQLRHALPNQKGSINIDAGSEYAVRTFYASLESADQLAALTDCGEDDTACEDQKALRMTNWLAMMAAIQDFEITLPDTDDLDDALARLDARLDVRDYAEQFSATILEDKLGVVAGGAITPVMEARDGTYNSVYFALGLNQGVADDSSVVFTRRANEPLPVTNADVTSLTYPNFVFSPTILGVINNLLVETLPFTRQSASLQSPATYVAGPVPAVADINKFIGTTISFMNSAGFMDLARRQIQAVTRESSSSPSGWLTNPHYTRVYTTRNASSTESSDSMATAFWSTGQLLSLEKEGANYRRLGIEEELNTFGWIFHSLTSADTEPFSAALLDGEEYMVVSLEHTSGLDPALAWSGSIDYWTVADETVTSLQPLTTDPENAGGSDVFTTAILQRTGSDEAVDIELSRAAASTLPLQALPTVVYNTNSKAFDDKFRGRLAVGDWIGMSDPLGNVLTFNTSNNGGLAHAVKVSQSVPDLAEATFTLYGNSVSIDADTTRYHNHNLGELRFAQGDVTLTLRERTVTADHSSLEVSAPADTSDAYALSPVTTTPALGAIRNQIALSFPDPTGGDTLLHLEGAAASDGNLLVLRLRYGNQIGLLYGFRTLALTENSN